MTARDAAVMEGRVRMKEERREEEVRRSWVRLRLARAGEMGEEGVLGGGGGGWREGEEEEKEEEAQGFVPPEPTVPDCCFPTRGAFFFLLAMPLGGSGGPAGELVMGRICWGTRNK